MSLIGIMKELFGVFKIQHHNSLAYRRKMNGTVETADKDIKNIILENCIMMYKDLHKILLCALQPYIKQSENIF